MLILCQCEAEAGGYRMPCEQTGCLILAHHNSLLPAGGLGTKQFESRRRSIDERTTVLMPVLRERAKSLIPNMAAGKKQAVSTNRTSKRKKKS
jgi:hypothetical protein